MEGGCDADLVGFCVLECLHQDKRNCFERSAVLDYRLIVRYAHVECCLNRLHSSLVSVTETVLCPSNGNDCRRDL